MTATAATRESNPGPAPSARRARGLYLAALASLVVVDLVLTGVFLAMTPQPGPALAVAMPVNAVILGALHAAGGWLLFQPIAAFLEDRGSRDHAAARLHHLPVLSTVWGVAVTLLYCAVIFASGVLTPERQIIEPVSQQRLVLASAWFAFVYAVYYGFYVYFVVTDVTQSLKERLYAAYRLQVPPQNGRLVRKLVTIFAIVTLMPLTLMVVDLSVFRPVRLAQGLTLPETVLLDGLSTAFVLAVATIFVTRSLTRPVGRLVEGHMAVSHGDLRTRAPVLRDDELGQVTASFNDMAADLQAQYMRVNKQLEQIAALQTETESAFQQTVHLLARAAELHDEVTGNHTVRVGEYARCLAQRQGQGEQFCREIAYAAQLHDVGKMSVDTAILRKPGKLEPAEWDEIKRHTVLGYQILEGVERLAMAADIALYHHEKWDGSGYPYGVAGTDIPLAARFTALADIYDALRSARPYKAGFSHDQAVAIMLNGDARLDPEKHFDPELLALFARYHRDFAEVWNAQLNAAAAQ